MKVNTSRSVPPLSRSLSKAAAPARSATTPPATAAPADQTLTIDLPGVGTKTYRFPTRFHDVELLTAQVALSTSAVAKWLPKGLEPVSTLGVTKGLVTFQHLGHPEQMEPYSEAQFAVRVRGPGGQEGWHVLDMPVNSFENKQRGQYIFGYPKEMATVGLDDKGLARTGTTRSPDGTPMFSLSVGPRLPFGIHHGVDNTAFQTLNGDLVKLKSTAEGRVAPGFGRVEFSDAMRARFPGLPAHPMVLFAGRLTDGELTLGLPEKP